MVIVLSVKIDQHLPETLERRDWGESSADSALRPPFGEDLALDEQRSVFEVQPEPLAVFEKVRRARKVEHGGNACAACPCANKVRIRPLAER